MSMDYFSQRVDAAATRSGPGVAGILSWFDRQGQMWIAPLGSPAPEPGSPPPMEWVPVRMRARRGDSVEAWIKRVRDGFDGPQSGHISEQWLTLDALLNDYRDHADTGTPLDQDVSYPGEV